MTNVVKVGVFITSMENFAAVNRVYGEWFGGVKPVSIVHCFLFQHPSILGILAVE